jgi:hypothetical protein
LLVLAAFAGIFAAIVTLGITLLSVWKCNAVRKDKREFVKFKNEQERCQLGDVSTFMFIDFMHAHARIFITLMHTCAQNLHISFLYQNSNIRHEYGNFLSALDVEMFCDNCAYCAIVTSHLANDS